MVKHISSWSGSHYLFDFSFKVSEEGIQVRVGRIIKLVKLLNVLFSKIVYDISTYAYSNKKDDYLHYRRITRFN